MTFILSVFAFLFIFSVIILIHELGHFLSARRHKVHVEEFGLGVPPKAKVLWKDKQNCEYTLNWVPFGGFIRMEGEDAVDEKVLKTKGSFANKSILARMEIVLAGVFMNFILAIFLLTTIFTIGSEPILINQDSIKANVDKGIIILDEGIPVMAIDENGPAFKAGLKTGDILLEIDGVKITEAPQISALQVANSAKNYLIKRPETSINNYTNEESTTYKNINLAITADNNAKIMVSFSSIPNILEIKKIAFPIHKAFMYSLEVSLDITKATISAFKGLIVQLFTQANIPKGVAGPVGIASMTHTIVEQGSLDALVKFMALLSLSLAIMNVLPIPALDGGRFVFLLIESIIRKPIKPEWEAKIHSVSYLLLLLLIFIITGNDIYNLIF